MTFQELGEILKNEREAKGLTIKEVMEATKISRVILLALESGDRSALPHPVYTKGFVKSYARLLGLDPDELTMVVDREYQMEPAEAGDISYDVAPNAEKAFQDNEMGPVRRRRSVWPTLLIVLALAAAVVILVLNLNKAQLPDVSSPEPAPTEQSVQPAEPEVAAPETAPGEEQSAPEAAPDEERGGEEEAGQAPATEPVPAESALGEVESAQEQAVAPAPASAEAVDEDASITYEDAPAEPKYDHVVIIRATSEKGCWIGVWRGEETKMARDFVLRKGEPLRLMFNSPRRIRIGNVAGVTMTYNGKPYALDSSQGNIQTLTFGL